MNSYLNRRLMRSFHSLAILSIGIVLLVPASSPAQEAPAKEPAEKKQDQASSKKPAKKTSAGINGSWRLEYDWNGAQVVDIYRLKVGKNGKLDGTVRRNDAEEFKIEDGKVDGAKIAFVVKGEYEGTAWVVNYEGKVGAEQIDGNVAIEAGDQSWDFPWQPSRITTVEDLIGTWMIRIENPNGEPFEPQLHIAMKEGAPKLKYVGSQGDEIAVKNFKYEDKNVSFDIETEINGNSIRLGYNGDLKGNAIEGELSYDLAGNTGETTFTAKRKKANAKTKTKSDSGEKAKE